MVFLELIDKKLDSDELNAYNKGTGENQ